MQCNYCHMKVIERTASRAGLVVVKQKSSGGITVLVKSQDEVVNKNKQSVAWFAALPSRCCC